MEKERWLLILRLGGSLVTIDAFIRWKHLYPTISSDVSLWTMDNFTIFARVIVGCFVETLAFHGGVMLASYVVLSSLAFFHTYRQSPKVVSGIRDEFRFSLIPLTIFYSSLTKLLLLFFLSIWRPSASDSSSIELAHEIGMSGYNVFFIRALEFWDEDEMDREWVVRNVLGGMAAGFGLRVVLDCHPFFTTIVIFAGWAVKTVVAGSVKDWVGAEEKSGEVWLAYSIP